MLQTSGVECLNSPTYIQNHHQQHLLLQQQQQQQQQAAHQQQQAHQLIQQQVQQEQLLLQQHGIQNDQHELPMDALIGLEFNVGDISDYCSVAGK